MNWLKTFSQAEYSYLLVFGILYLAYSVRIYFLSKKIKLNLRRIIAKFILRTAYFALFLAALLGPSFGDIKKEIKAIGKDIYFVIDVSNSMAATDVAPSRLEKTKYELSRAIRAFHSDRIGLLVFSEDAFIQCPLTYDHQALKLFLDHVHTNIASGGSTDLAAALALAYSKFTTTSDGSHSQEHTKILLLATDGENFGELSINPWLGKLKEASIHVFVLGVGSKEGSTMKIENNVLLDMQGEPAISYLNRDELQRIANLTDGNYYEITPGTNDIKTLVNKIVRVEGKLHGSIKIDSAANKYFYFLAIAIGLLMTDILITIKTFRI